MTPETPLREVVIMGFLMTWVWMAVCSAIVVLLNRPKEDKEEDGADQM